MTKNVSYLLENLIDRYPILASVKEEIQKAFDEIRACYEAKGKLLVAGCGGSCSDAEHIVGELMKGFVLPRSLDEKTKEALCQTDPKTGRELASSLQRGLPAVALSSHPSLNTAFMNDLNDMFFAQQLFVLGNEGDVFFAISTSGNSKLVYPAAVTAKAKGMKVVALTGKTGGALKSVADVNIIVPCDETYQIQELHLPVYHCLCLMLEEYFFS